MSKPTGVLLETLPQGGEFILALLNNSGEQTKIKGRFSMYVLDRFCEDKDLTFLQLIGKVTLGMRVGEYAELMVLALQDYFRNDVSQAGTDWEGERVIWNKVNVMDYILDPMGGLGNQTMQKLFEHCIRRLGAIMKDESAAPDDKKKEELN